MRIRWQSFTEPGTAYVSALEARLAELSAPDTTFEVVGLTPPDRYIHRLHELRCAYQVVTENLDAADQGVDALVIGHFQDGGVPELRAASDIPVVGLGEAAMHQAAMLGDGFGLVTIHPGFLAYHRDQVRRIRLESSFVGVEAMTCTSDMFQAAFAGDVDATASVHEQFRERAMRLVDQGADVVIPAGGYPALLLQRAGAPDLGGAALLDPIGVAVLQAEMWCRLAALSGLRPGRTGSYATPEPGVLADLAALRQAPPTR